MAEKTKAIRKHQQISKSNQNMFIAIAVASALVGFALVASIFLVNKMIFNQRVISAKMKTLDNLRQTNKNLPELRDEIKLLETNEALRSARLDNDQETVRVILDALPATNNPTALGASVRKLLDIEGITIDSLSVGDVENAASTPVDSNQSLGTISFQFKIESNDIANLNQILKRLERSVRAIHIDRVELEMAMGENAKNYLTVTAHSYYQLMLEAKLDETTLEAKKK